MNNATLINQTSGKVEFWTPQPIIEAARETMGKIDLDPASCFAANERVRAASYFSKDDDGLSKRWYGNVWLNMPFLRETNARWVNKIVSSFHELHIEKACCITFASTSEAWFRPLLDFPQVFLVPRTNYVLPDGTIMRGVTKGSVVTGFGVDIPRFKKAFEKLGVIKVRV